MSRKKPRRRAVLVVCDSLRPDLITPDVAPNLSKLAETSLNFMHHASVFTSTTRVCAATVATGCWPGNHSLAGNHIALDEGDGLVCLSTGEPDFRHRMRKATGRTLHRRTLAERLAEQGGAVAFSNVSPGAAYFLDPDGYGFVYHRSGSYSPGCRPLTKDSHLDIKIGIAGDEAMTSRFCREVLRELRPAFAVLWLSEPDHTGHEAPLGSPAHKRAIACADTCVGAVVATVQELDPHSENTLLMICSDHGMETSDRTIPIDQLLVEAGLKESMGSSDVVVAPNGSAALVYVSEPAVARVDDILYFLSEQDWVGRTFAGRELAELGHAANSGLAIAITLRATDRINEFGVAGYSDIVANPAENKDYTGFGQHGGLGPHEQKPFLFVLGGGFATGVRMEKPTSLVDIAPTILRHLGLHYDDADGRPLMRH